MKVSELLAQGHTADALRLYLLSKHYREQHNFEPAELDGWEQRAATLRQAVDGPGGPPDTLLVQHFRNDFMEAMDADFDTPRATRVLLRIAQGIIDGRLAGDTAIPTLIELAGVLGLRLGEKG